MKKRNQRMVKWGVLILLLLLAFGQKILTYFGLDCSCDQVETAQPEQGGDINLPDSTLDGQMAAPETVESVETVETVETGTVSRELVERTSDNNTYDTPELESLMSNENTYEWDNGIAPSLMLKPHSYEYNDI